MNEHTRRSTTSDQINNQWTRTIQQLVSIGMNVLDVSRYLEWRISMRHRSACWHSELWVAPSGGNVLPTSATGKFESVFGGCRCSSAFHTPGTFPGTQELSFILYKRGQVTSAFIKIIMCGHELLCSDHKINQCYFYWHGMSPLPSSIILEQGPILVPALYFLTH